MLDCGPAALGRSDNGRERGKTLPSFATHEFFWAEPAMMKTLLWSILAIAALSAPVAATQIEAQTPSPCLKSLQRRSNLRTLIPATGFLFDNNVLVIVPKACGKSSAMLLSLTDNRRSALANSIRRRLPRSTSLSRSPIGIDILVRGVVDFSNTGLTLLHGDVVRFRVLSFTQSQRAYAIVGGR